ncbi:TetR/AcrR family transcriptional regulator [Streptomyces ipomoeae]|uniref:Transcriptional regulator, TetR family n=1 Tax=Streptomyces ipomoeae 91-03 TaxID=698759 RepID=L1KUS0_9ACTN|nr:TetR/AcrR family transcriptional regulator [Streptomyces ipomoeae]EKX64143.1 transcriptional regulator, TetR family [Streptomyces ipomoeae 91-03]MDX2695346.1 TetR/AcrR family transcriptional regulator [Streptomyces ipomoeae]MDX2820335.1 TetR/AcrR family transcriptional regulator [Streptomyces ipomoeae]MDX2934803.1 TetR/AcrR family transcriptional regulator [Streptomyces ipomoeae]TQE21021.1 TetR/AcrR family transcriptional regulator [Streptomyces ipomoeae]
MNESPPPFPAPQDLEPLDGLIDLATTPADQPRLRADAARNRTRLLEVAARLADECGAANLTMEAVANAAEVGKGTVFRRFGDRFGLLVALLDHHERELQAAFLTGPPPLGPDAPPAERLRAFGAAVIRHEYAHRDLYLAARADASRRHTSPAELLRLNHLCMLLRLAEAKGDIELLARTLLGYLDIGLVDHLVSRRGMSLERLEAGWGDLVGRFVAAA